MKKLLFSLMLLNFLNITVAQHDSLSQSVPPPPPRLLIDPVEEMPILLSCDSLDASYGDKKKCSDIALIKYIQQNIQYPLSARKKKMGGTVVVQFTVNADGSVSDEKVVKSVDPALDEEALRLIKNMPAWAPGRQGGKAIRVQYTVPVRFKLQ
jgi:TonB family protein